MTRYTMAIDLDSCIGCHSCAVVCKQENNVGLGTFYSKVLTIGPSGTYPDLEMYYLPVACQHCENPACVKVCPVGATYQDPETGVVRQDYDKCIGCRMCMAACPYTGVRSFNWEEPKYFLDFAVGSADAPKHQKHTVGKCTVCWHRIAKGERPMCADVCRNQARWWGDLDDPESDGARLFRPRSHEPRLPGMGTEPNVYSLV